MKHPGRTGMEASAGVRVIEPGEAKTNHRLKKVSYFRLRLKITRAPNKAKAVELGSGTGAELKTSN